MTRGIDYRGEKGPHADLAAVLGAVICRERARRGLTQPELAGAIGLTTSTLSRMERGGSAVSIDSLDAMARLLGTSASAMLAEAERLLAALGGSGVAVMAPGARPGLGYLNARRLEGALAVIEPPPPPPPPPARTGWPRSGPRREGRGRGAAPPRRRLLFPRDIMRCVKKGREHWMAYVAKFVASGGSVPGAAGLLAEVLREIEESLPAGMRRGPRRVEWVPGAGGRVRAEYRMGDVEYAELAAAVAGVLERRGLRLGFGREEPGEPWPRAAGALEPYQLLEANNLDWLRIEANRLARLGYVPAGGPALDPHSRTIKQAMFLAPEGGGL